MQESPAQHTVSSVMPVMLDVPAAARLLGVGRTLAYDLIRAGRWPTPVIRVGRLIRVPSGPILELLATGASGLTA
jgi:predicted DNA-binding transcriptional regulator AlpA